MAFLDTSLISWTYTADDGTLYNVNALKSHTDQAKQGGNAGSTSQVHKPADMKMRRVTCRTAGGISRVFPLYDTTTATLGTKGTTINANVDGVSTEFVSQGNPIPQSHKRNVGTSQTT